MKDWVVVARWLDNAAPPLDPSAMQYRAVAANGVDPGLPDCEEKDTETRRTFVYVLTKLDPRQLPIPGAAQITEE